MVFTCEICGARPDSHTQELLEEQLQFLLFGEYLDSEPDGWLTWTGNGIYGRPRHGCATHRDALKASVREDYGSLGFHPWAEGPHPAGWHLRDEAWRVRRRRALAQLPGFSGGLS